MSMNSSETTLPTARARASAPDLWREAFGDLDRLAALDVPAGSKALACAERLHALARQVADRDVREHVTAAGAALAGYGRGEPQALAAEFDRIVCTPAAKAGREAVFALFVKHVHQGQPQPLIVHGALNRRVLEAQAVLRAKPFLDLLARRLGLPEASADCTRGRVQGLDVEHLAGHSRYAVFFDFVDGVDAADAGSRGGILLSVVADDFLGLDFPLVERRMPSVAARLQELGVVNPAATRFLYPTFLALHDAVGHKCPHPLNHPHKRAVPSFLLDPVEELGADAQFFWACTADVTRPACRAVMTEAELAALPLLWLMKRLFHYPQRGTRENPEHGALALDADARTGLLWWGFLCAHQAVRFDGDRIEVDFAALPRVFGLALDAWMEVERELARGVEPYRRALARFTAEYVVAAQGLGIWMVPAPLRMAS